MIILAAKLSALSAVAVSTALGAVAPPAADYAPADIADAQCVVVAIKWSDPALTADANQAESGQRMTFFIGKLKGRNPAVDLAGLLRTVGPEVKRNLAAYASRCNAEAEALGAYMAAVGEALNKDGSLK